MKTMKILAVLALVATCTAGYAQNSSAGIKGGLNFSSLTTDGNDDKNLKLGFHVGVFDKISLSESFAIQPELLYSIKGQKYEYDGYADGETKFNLHYIDLPVKLVFNLSEDFSIFAGPYASYLISAGLETNAEVLNSYQIDSEDEVDRKYFNTIDYGLTAGIGFDLDPLIFGVNYNLGLNQVAKDDKPSYDMLGDAKNTVIQAYVGIKF